MQTVRAWKTKAFALTGASVVVADDNEELLKRSLQPFMALQSGASFTMEELQTFDRKGGKTTWNIPS